MAATSPISTKYQDWLDGVSISNDVFALRPDYRAAIVIAEGLTPGPSDAASERALSQAELKAKAATSGNAVDQHPRIADWREAYNAFGAKPKKFKPSVEALVRRVDGGLPRIDRLTDLYNSVSVSHLLPLGGEDLDSYNGPARLIRATGSETFDTVASGAPITETPPAGEVVWADATGVTCRRWNWRQCTRTRITDKSTNVVFILDALGSVGEAGLEEATEDLMRDLQASHPEVKLALRNIHA